ncbi:RND family efflux transporter MFP subunit [Chitinivorax tropicus]|uniref:RND family efflux transporter MFP subunit n=1 Tax=Chitinivorax tropicus TaxID=714531 RepID=A0A840MBQ6_9PROT|nr:efflux RND transporter periplasmic adaptor subunit [Chitinivorax tropicus]MBB5016764.1 RND family efflux transporter MFP subunit [Chitinivorax tropicus]
MNRLRPIVYSLCAMGAIALAVELTGCAESQAGKQPTTTATASPWAAIAKGRISIEGGVINIAAPRPGIVQAVLVEEGTEVKAGAVLARIDDRESQLALRIKEQERDEARATLALLTLRQQIAQREWKRIASLPDDEVVSNQDRDNAKDQLTLANAEVTRQQATVAAAEAQVSAGRLEVEQHVVKAPLDGRIIRRQAKPGDGASTLNVTPLFMFAPHGPRIVRADLEERFVRSVASGQSAEVVLEADESKVYKAKVLRLGEVFGSRPENDDPTEKQDVRVIECVLSLDAPELKIGQRVVVKIAHPTTSGRS